MGSEIVNEKANESPTSSNTSAIVFTSPFEDTSGLDVFAQIAASAHPLPVVEIPEVPRSSIATSSSIVQKSQSQLAQTIYQNQQALRLQQQQKIQQQPSQTVQKRDSIDSTISKFDPKINDENMDDYDDDDDFDSDSDEDERMSSSVFNRGNNDNSIGMTLKLESAIADV